MLLDEFGPFKIKTRVVVREDRESVASAIAHRILHAHPEKVGEYGAKQVIDAIDDVAEFVGDVEEIGSSDVSGWVKQVFNQLSRQKGMSETRPSINRGGYNRLADKQDYLDKRDHLFKLLSTSGVSSDDKSVIKQRLLDLDYAAKKQGLIESLRPGEYHVATVTLDNGEVKKFKVTFDEGYTDVIKNFYARQGRTVTDIDIDWSIRTEQVNEFQDEEETGDLRTGWLIKKAKRQFPMASSDAEAVAMWMNDKEEKDVERLDRVNDIEDAMIDRLADVDSKVQNKLNDVEHRLRALEKSQSNESLRATAQEVSKYLAEMKESGYDI